MCSGEGVQFINQTSEAGPTSRPPQPGNVCCLFWLLDRRTPSLEHTANWSDRWACRAYHLPANKHTAQLLSQIKSPGCQRHAFSYPLSAAPHPCFFASQYILQKIDNAVSVFSVTMQPYGQSSRSVYNTVPLTKSFQCTSWVQTVALKLELKWSVDEMIIWWTKQDSSLMKPLETSQADRKDWCQGQSYWIGN